MEEIIREELKYYLSEKRYVHSIGVMKRAGELAQIYGVDEKEARLTGLVHDIAKEIPEEEKIRYCQANGIEMDAVEMANPSLLHAKIGADMAKKQYGFTTSMQQAIAYHTTGNPHMDMLANIIFIADKTEENRTFDGVEALRKLSEEDIEAAIIETIHFNILKAMKKQKLIHPDSIITRNALIQKRGEENE